MKELTLASILLVTSPLSDFAASSLPPRPNILFILADDLGWRDLGNEGSYYYESPNLDRLSRAGMKFTRGYAACQVCSPSRASILTGKYPTKHGVTDWIGEESGTAWREVGRETSLLPADYDHNLRASEITLADALRAAGYQTFFAGKWHLGGEKSRPEDHGFMINQGGWDAGSPHGGYFSPYGNPALKDGPPGESLPIRLARETAAFIEANRNKPFLAYLSFYSVHAPIQTTSALWRKYRDKAVAMEGNNVAPRFIWDRRLAVRQVQDCPIYAGMIESMDDAIGLVLAKVKELGLEKNTIICFTSDNGGVSSGDAFSTSNLPMRGGKGRQWEGGLREPFYVVVPGLTKPDTTCAVPVSGIDWYPTLLDLAGVPVPAQQDIDGVSLVPLLTGGHIPDRPLFWHYPHYGNQGGEPSSVITQDDWKLIHYYEDGREELYHLSADPGESHDLASAEPDRVKSMRAQLNNWLQTTKAKLPVHDPEYTEEKNTAYLKKLRTTGMEHLEKMHAEYLDPTFKPNRNWWGSTPEE